MTLKIFTTIELSDEQDLVFCRQRVREIAELLEFDRQDQTRIATAVSEIARNAFEYAKRGRVEIGVSDREPPVFVIVVRDAGPGIPQVKSILNGQYVSKTGLGLGIRGAKRLMEFFEVDSEPGKGTRVTLGRTIPLSKPEPIPRILQRVSGALTKQGARNLFQELQRQNQELLRTLEELQAQKAELAQLNRELGETNRGVVALYAELDEKADSLRKASETKTSFLSHITHEFRTPLNSIIGLSRAALSGDEGELNPEHKTQVTYIKKSAESLSDLVNDLLDIAKVESGKVDVREKLFDVRELIGGLRGVLKPIAVSRPHVSLVFDEPPHDLVLKTDEGKLAQILRNLITNALKYTEQGDVRLSVDRVAGDQVRFRVMDTGIGIAPDDQERIFEEFIQIESPLQGKFKGTGLGLPLSRKLAELLGGSLSVTSLVNRGSTFSLVIPIQYAAAEFGFDGSKSLVPEFRVEISDHGRVPRSGSAITWSQQERPKILIIDDEEVSRYLMKEMLSSSSAILLEASDGFEGVRMAIQEQPRVIFLDLQMPTMSGFYVLELLKASPLTTQIPIIVHTAMTLTLEERKKLAPNVVSVIPKAAPSREQAKRWIKNALLNAGVSLDGDELEVNIG